MTTSWSETQQIEAHLQGYNDTGTALLFEARLLLDPTLADNVQWQQKTYTIVQNYARRELKQEIEAVYQELFTQPRHLVFSARIRKLFSKK